MRNGFRGAMVLSLLILPLATTPAKASEMTPFQNGSTWIAGDCATDPRGYSVCAQTKCATLYPPVIIGGNDINAGARRDCLLGAAMAKPAPPPGSGMGADSGSDTGI